MKLTFQDYFRKRTLNFVFTILDRKENIQFIQRFPARRKAH